MKTRRVLVIVNLTIMGKISLFIRENSKDIIIGIDVVAGLFVMGWMVKKNNETRSWLSSAIEAPK